MFNKINKKEMELIYNPTSKGGKTDPRNIFGVIEKINELLKEENLVIKFKDSAFYTDDLKLKLPTPNRSELTTQIELWKKEIKG
jgi:hypothetical protein